MNYVTLEFIYYFRKALINSFFNRTLGQSIINTFVFTLGKFWNKLNEAYSFFELIIYFLFLLTCCQFRDNLLILFAI